MIIKELTVKNVKRVSFVRVLPDGSLVPIAGQNGEGKSSTIGAIPYILGGKALCPDVPIRLGETSGEASALLADPDGTERFRVTRSWQLGEAPKLVVKQRGIRAALKKPQQILDGLRKFVPFDPMAFSTMPGDKQAEILRQLVGLDLSGLDQRRDEAYRERTEVNRDLHRAQAELEALPHHDDAAAEEVSVHDLMVELECRQKHNADNEALRTDLADAGRRKAAAENQVELLESRLAQAQKALATTRTEVETLEAEVEWLEDLDVDAVRTEIAGAEEQNRKVRENASWAGAKGRAEALDKRSKALTTDIEKADAEKAEAIAGAEYPVEGLVVTDNGVTFRGLPIEQASTAERLIVGTAVGFALNPEIKVLCIENGSALDRKSRALLGQIADEHGGQCWLEVIDEEGAAVVIKDGAAVEGGAS